MKPPVVDYRKLRPGNLRSHQYRHLFYLLFWPLFGLAFYAEERLYQVDFYHIIYCPLDDYIPFLEIFVIPYLVWFAFLVFQHLYGLLYDIDNFKWLMRYILITYMSAVVIYFFYPNCQELRPQVFARDNILTRFMAGFYQFDTNTNVCPSIHVMGSLAVWSASRQAKPLQKPLWRVVFAVIALSICASTVFLKQHSVLDVLWALPICVLAEIYCRFMAKREKRNKKCFCTSSDTVTPPISPTD